MPFPVETDYARWGRIRRCTRDEFFALDSLKSGLLLIDYGAVELALLVANRGASATYYGFHAALSPHARRTVPYFQGGRIAPRTMNRVLVCDPSLYLGAEVHSGWFLGNRHCRMAEELPAAMDKLDELMGAGRRLLWGNSAGGTAALRYAREADVAVVMNPQTILADFAWNRVEPWVRLGWGIADYEEARAFVRAAGDLRAAPPRGRIVYCQNVHDEHVHSQLAPLAEAMGVAAEPGDTGRFRLILGDWGKGHIPPPPDFQKAIVAEEAERMVGRPKGLLGWLGR